MDLDLSPVQTAVLENRSEGWAAGLQLAALALQGASRQGQENPSMVHRNPGAGSHRFIVDYLVEEVMKKQPPALQDFISPTEKL
jgi:LuxR family transcriptional regulator, maltose regulon positive regulatory protein